MERVIDVAGYIVRRYKETTGEDLDKMKLQKLLYFTQRESFAIVGHEAFEGAFEGWKYGPVCREVYTAYQDGVLHAQTREIGDDVQYIVNNVIVGYGALASWRLSQISHKDSAWKNARRGLSPDEDGHVQLKLEDIRRDAEKLRPYDYVWDMYYDEFEDAGVNGD